MYKVQGILSLGGGEAIKQIVSDFEDAGYHAKVHLVNMADYGIPQTRQRVFIIGQRKDLGETLKFQFPKPTHSNNGSLIPWVSIKEAIGHLPDPDSENTIANGFAMRTDIHTLFDTGHLRIAVDEKVELSTRARMDYGATIPPKIEIPSFINKDFLRWRWDNYNGL